MTMVLAGRERQAFLEEPQEGDSMNKRVIIGCLSCAVLLGLGATTAVADPNLNNVPPHRHFIRISATDMVEVGPVVCDNPSLQSAFNQFHNNLHISAGFGPAAPGLHNGTGGELVATAC
jgi:hypothetical protein